MACGSIKAHHHNKEHITNTSQAVSYLSRYDSAHARNGSPVQTADALFREDSAEAVPRALVQPRVSALHARLHHIDGVVAEHTGAPSDQSTNDGLGHAQLGLAASGHEVLVGVEHHETQALIGSLLQNSGNNTLIQTTNTTFSENSLHARDEGLVGLDQFRLDSLHGSDDQDSFSDASTHACCKLFAHIELSLIVCQQLLVVRIGSESDTRFWNGQHLNEYRYKWVINVLYQYLKVLTKVTLRPLYSEKKPVFFTV